LVDGIDRSTNIEVGEIHEFSLPLIFFGELLKTIPARRSIPSENISNEFRRIPDFC
jgi:hypothetical protein